MLLFFIFYVLLSISLNSKTVFFFYLFFFMIGKHKKLHSNEIELQQREKLRGHSSKEKKQAKATSHTPLKLHASQS